MTYQYFSIVNWYSTPELTERVNVFLSTLLRQQFRYEWIFQELFTHVYFTREQVRTILGHSYLKILAYLIDNEYIAKETLYTRYGHKYHAYRFICSYSGYTKSNTKHKRVNNSVQKYLKTKMSDFDKKYHSAIISIKRVRLNLSYDEFISEMTNEYYENIEEVKTTLDDYLYSCRLQYELIMEFQQSKGRKTYEYITVDKFGGRLHTPFTNLPKRLRKYVVTKKGEPMESIDLNQSQPRILSEILRREIPNNSLTELLDQGGDVYEFIGESLGLDESDRKTKKVSFYKMIFGYPSKNIKALIDSVFPDITEWIAKTNTTPNRDNPSSKVHSNLAMMLQRYESELFTSVWNALFESNITFVTVHDEVLVNRSKHLTAMNIMSRVLSTKIKEPILVSDLPN